MRLSKSRLFFLPVLLLSALAGAAQTAANDWSDARNWSASGDGKSSIEIKSAGRGAIVLHYRLNDSGWVQAGLQSATEIEESRPIAFFLKADAPSDLEIKMEDRQGATFLQKLSLAGRYRDWTRVVFYRKDLDYGWGGQAGRWNGFARLYFALSGPPGEGTVWLRDIGQGDPSLASTLSPDRFLDPDRELTGVGERQRRNAVLTPEDPLVYEWLKAVQDSASPERRLVPSMEDGVAQTFNNALAAMVFTLKRDRERAERILDFYAAATRPDNRDPSAQEFYCAGQARGFFQSIALPGGEIAPYHALPDGDRWTGDMAWLLIACKYYDRTFAPGRYDRLETLLKDLLLSFYKEDRVGGYVQSGWWKGDREVHVEGYGEPNLDCYAALRLCGETQVSGKIKAWLDDKLQGRNLPLDNYTWRVLAFGKESAEAIKVPEYDLRFRKALLVRGKKVLGFFDKPADVDNQWLDGTGHMACAQFAIGDAGRGNFYANQLDAYLIERNIGGKRVKALPYTANALGGYGWVRLDRGFASTAAWYMFAKNRFNPMTLTQAPARVR